jgi:hypothetical protein
MPSMVYEPKVYNDKSTLTDGWHPAYLLAISDEPTPESWKMYAASPRMWRWAFAVWPTPDAITQGPPERQSAPSSQKFTPKGRQPASKAYAWTSALLGNKQILPGESVNLDPLMPLPCRAKIERNGEYANIIDVEPWPDGTAYLTPELRAKLQTLLDQGSPPPTAASTQSPATTPAAAAYVPPPPPGMQSWGQPAPASTPAVSPDRPRW